MIKKRSLDRGIFARADYKRADNNKRVILSRSADGRVVQTPQRELNIDADAVKQSAQPYMSQGFGGSEPHGQHAHFEESMNEHIDVIMKDKEYKQNVLKYMTLIMEKEKMNELTVNDFSDKESTLHSYVRYMIENLIADKFTSKHQFINKPIYAKINNENSLNLLNEIYDTFSKLADNIRKYRLERKSELNNKYEKSRTEQFIPIDYSKYTADEIKHILNNTDSTTKIEADTKKLKEQLINTAMTLSNTCIQQHNSSLVGISNWDIKIFDEDIKPENTGILDEILLKENKLEAISDQQLDNYINDLVKNNLNINYVSALAKNEKKIKDELNRLYLTLMSNRNTKQTMDMDNRPDYDNESDYNNEL